MWIVKKSKVHGHGVFANSKISKSEKIIEYIGEKISKKEGDKRSNARLTKYLGSKKTGSVYIFELDKKYDSFKAATYWLPDFLIMRPGQNQLPNKYFCSEHVVYMIKQLGYLKDVTAEKITPNHIEGLVEQLTNEIALKH